MIFVNFDELTVCEYQSLRIRQLNRAIPFKSDDIKSQSAYGYNKGYNSTKIIN